MMADLMHQDMGDEMLERVVAVRPFVEDRAAEQADAVRQRARMVDASLGDRNAFVDAGQVERLLDAHRAERLVVGEILDQQYDVAKMARERLRQRVQRPARDRLHLVGRGGISEAPHRHAA